MWRGGEGKGKVISTVLVRSADASCMLALLLIRRSPSASAALGMRGTQRCLPESLGSKKGEVPRCCCSSLERPFERPRGCMVNVVCDSQHRYAYLNQAHDADGSEAAILYFRWRRRLQLLRRCCTVTGVLALGQIALTSSKLRASAACTSLHYCHTRSTNPNETNTISPPPTPPEP